MRKHMFGLFIACLIAVFLSFVTPVPLTQAANPAPRDCAITIHGRCLNEGYFTGDISQEPGDPTIFPLGNYFEYDDYYVWSLFGTQWSFPQVVGSTTSNPGYTNQFIELLRNYINADYTCTLNATVHGDPNTDADGISQGSACFNARRDAVGAANIVDTMMGLQGPSFGSGTYNSGAYQAAYGQGVLQARTFFPLFEAVIRQYDSLGLIDWNANSGTPPGHYNTTSMNYGTDIQTFRSVSGYPLKSIVVRNPSGDILIEINRGCANTINDTSEVPLLHDFEVTATPDVQLDNDESPTIATFTLSAEVDAGPVNQIDFARFYYIDPKVGANIPLSVQPIVASVESEKVDFPDTSPKSLPTRVASGVAVSSLSVGDKVCVLVVFAPKSGKASVDGTIMTTVIASDTIEKCKTVIAKPYFKLNNGDIAAGMGAAVGSSCPGWGTSGSGTLTSWNFGSIASNFGAGTNLAAYALGVIDGFASAQSAAGFPASGSSPPTGLSFASTAGTFGGSFGGGIACPSDYYATLPTPASPLTGAFAVPDTNNAYTVTSAAAQITGGNITTVATGGHRPVIYVDGDIRITGNITLTHGATIASLSSFYLIVRGGNIYIDPGVTQLDGVYIAQPNGAVGGKIYTCSAPGNNPPRTAPSDLNGVCRNQLIVNGAFIAKELKLYRSIGSQTPGPPAEIFNYTPATWLAAPTSIGDSELGGYDAITSLPPIL